MSASETSMVKFVKEMSTGVNVGMEEVVSVFVTKYEDGLHVEKDRLSAEVKRVKSELSQLNTRIKNVALNNQQQYEFVNGLLGISSKVQSVSVDWNQSQEDKVVAHRITYAVKVYDATNESYYAGSFNKSYHVSIGETDVATYTDLSRQLENLTSSLSEVLTTIKGIGRKERQIRGKISALKLEQSGYAGLLDSPELQQLIEIK